VGQGLELPFGAGRSTCATLPLMAGGESADL